MNSLYINSQPNILTLVHHSKNEDDGKNIHFMKLPNGLKVNTASISYLKAESNYTYMIFKNGSSILISKTLKYLEQIIGIDFIRVHQSFLINKNEVQFYNKSTGMLTLHDGQRIMASRSRKKQVYAALQ